jgi:hypothetical protein
VARLSLTGWSGPATFSPHAYVRDEVGPYWIVHFRLFPETPDEYWIKWDSKWGRLVDIRSKLASAILSFKGLRNVLWYRAERCGGRPNIQALGLVRLAAGETLKLEVDCAFSRADE